MVVPTFRRHDNTVERLVRALGAQDLEPDRFEVVIVDNQSGDDTMAVLNRLAASVAR